MRVTACVCAMQRDRRGRGQEAPTYPAHALVGERMVPGLRRGGAGENAEPGLRIITPPARSSPSASFPPSLVGRLIPRRVAGAPVRVARSQLPRPTLRGRGRGSFRRAPALTPEAVRARFAESLAHAERCPIRRGEPG